MTIDKTSLSNYRSTEWPETRQACRTTEALNDQRQDKSVELQKHWMTRDKTRLSNYRSTEWPETRQACRTTEALNDQRQVKSVELQKHWMTIDKTSLLNYRSTEWPETRQVCRTTEALNDQRQDKSVELQKHWMTRDKTSLSNYRISIFFHSSRMTSFRDWMLDGEWCSTCLFRIPHRCSIGFRSGDILGHWITFTLFFFRNPTVALDLCLGSLSSWKSARWPRARSDGSIFSFSIEQYICEFMMPSMKCSSPPPTPAALMQPHIRTLPPPCFTVSTMDFSLYSSPLRRHTVLKPSVPKTFILVSSLQSIESH